VSVPVFMFCSPGVVSRGTEGVGSVFKFCAPELVFGSTAGIGSRFHVLRARTYFRWYRGCRVCRIPFSCFMRPDSFYASGPIFVFCFPGHIFDGTEGVGSRFLILRAWTRLQRKRGCRVPFSCFALPESFPVIPRASGPVFKFCALRLVFGSTAGIGSRFHVLCAQTHFRRFRGRRLPCSCFVLLDSF
jgi:hypothetical protein